MKRHFELVLNKIAILMVVICLMGVVCAFTACDDDNGDIDQEPREVVIEVIKPNTNDVLRQNEYIDFPGENTKIEVRIRDKQTGAYIGDEDLPDMTIEESLSFSIVRLDKQAESSTQGVWPMQDDSSGNHFQIMVTFDCKPTSASQDYMRKYAKAVSTIRFYYNDIGDVVVDVERVVINFADGNEIGLTESKQILIDVLPYYTNCEYVIEKIERPNGELYVDDFAKYAHIENDTLYTTKEIEIGSKIYFHAQSIHNVVVSNTLTAQIVRIDIERVELLAPYWQSNIKPGEELELTLSIFPKNATVNILNDSPIDVSLANCDIATLEKVGDRKYLLKASDDSNIAGQEINISVGVENINKSVRFVVDAIPIEKMIILRADTGAELDAVTYLTRGSTLNLDTEITPSNATVRNLSYNLWSNTTNFGAYINIDESGRLTISNNAPLNMEVFVNVTASRQNSKTYKIIIEPREVESVTISAEQDYIVKGSVLIFKRVINPENADIISSTEYKLVEEVEGVYISGNSVYASNDAVANTQIKIVAIVNGVESNVLILTVVDAPPA